MKAKGFLWLWTFLLAGILPVNAKEQHGIARHGEVKYPSTFTHFDSVNPTAPKGGEFRLTLVGTFDTLNPFILKGTPPAGIQDILFESLMKRSPDEPFSLYGLIAESIDVAPDNSWAIFKLNPKAKWQDGKPITTKDVAFSFQTFLKYGTPAQKMYYTKVDKVEILGDLQIKFTFKKVDEKYDAEMPLIMGVMAVLAEHDLKGKNFEKTGMRPLLTSGPYKVKKVDAGRLILYERDPNYWAVGLPVNKGYFNFDQIQFTFYKNSSVAFEAFKAGYADAWEERDARKWATNYTFPAVKKGLVQRVEIPHRHQVGMQGFVFNTRRELFQDPLVRKALTYLFNYDWLNKNIFHGVMTRTTSFFDNTELAAKGLPEGQELTLLNPFKMQLPQEVFEKPYTLPTFAAGSRENFKIALDLLKKAGWHIKNKQLVHEKTGEPFVFEILLNGPEHEKMAMSFAQTLKQAGIHATVRTVESAQYENRRMNMDFDMLVHFWGHTLSPGNEQSFYWSSKAADEPGTRNYPGIKSPVIDHLCHKVTNAQTREELVAAVKALDRVLLWGHYVIPFGYRRQDTVAYWNKIAHPPLGPMGLPSIHTLWVKEESSRP